MPTSDTLKALMKEDGPIDVREGPARSRSNAVTDRLQTLWRSIWRRRWSFMTAAWAICALGWGMITLWPVSYVASAVVYANLVELRAVSPEDASAGRPPVALLKSMMMSEENLADMQDRLSLDPEASGSLANDIVLRSTVPPVFVVAYEHKSAEMAHKVVDSLITGFETRLDDIATTSLQEAETLGDQIRDHERRLQTSEADLVAFRRGNADYLKDADDRTAELAQLEEETARLEAEVTTAIADRDAVAAELAEVRAPNGGGPQPKKSPEQIETERQTLQAQLAQLQERYADTHPYVMAVIEALNTLEAEGLAQETANAVIEAGDQLPLDRDELEQRHGELIVEVATLSSRLGEKRREFELLQALTKTTRSVEAKLSELEAEKDALKTALSDLRQRQSQLGELDGGETEQKPFRLIRPPELPDQPVGPSRLMALAAVLVGGTGVGALVAVICNRFKGVYESAWQLKKRFDVGVLGTIAEVMSPEDRRKLTQARWVFGGACAALVGVFGGLVVAELTDSLAVVGEQMRTRFLG